MKAVRKQNGLSLIELMIGILLSSLIIAAVLSIFSSARTSSLLIDAESKMLDEAQFAMENLNSVIRMTGYTMDPKAGSNSNLALARNGDVITGSEGGEISDRIRIWYEGNSDGSVFDCIGDTVDALPDGTGIVVENEYIVSDGTLLCSRSLGDDNPETNLSRPLIDGVAKLDFRYGLDTDNDGMVNQYKIYNNLSVSDRLNIVGVMVELTLEAQVTGDLLQKTFTSAVQLRNRTE